MRKNFLFAMAWSLLLLWPSTQGESKVHIISEPSLDVVEKLYSEIEAELKIVERQQDSLNLLK